MDVTPPFDVEVELREQVRDDVRASIETHHPEFVVQVLEAEGRVRGY